MHYLNQYQHYYRQLPSDIVKYKSSGKSFVFGYASDLDVILAWDEHTFAALLATYLKEAPSVREGDAIDSMADFARVISYYMILGLGGQIDITDPEVCDYLEKYFKVTFGLGGTCAQGATALGKIGFPSVVHITDKSSEVCGQMDGLGIETIQNDRRVPIMENVIDKPPIRHIIFQYPQGVRLQIATKEYVIPVSNRVILDYDRVHKVLPLDSTFLKYCEQNAQDILAYSSSGFNSIISPEIMQKRTQTLSKHYRVMKARNRNCFIYLESAHYMSSEVNSLLFDNLKGTVDLLGMNEEELIEHSRKHGISVDKEKLASVLGGLQFIVEHYSLKGVVLHTKDYALYYGERITGMDCERGLTLGNLMAGTRARTGQYGTYEDCGETLPLSLSPAGVAFAEALEKMNVKQFARIVPSFYMQRPKCTIGLGDAFMAGFMTSFVC